MTDKENWTTVPATDVKAGDRIRHREQEFDVARVDQKFLGRDNMICFIEDTDQRWAAWPAVTTAEVQRLR